MLVCAGWSLGLGARSFFRVSLGFFLPAGSSKFPDMWHTPVVGWAFIPSPRGGGMERYDRWLAWTGSISGDDHARTRGVRMLATRAQTGDGDGSSHAASRRT